MWLTAGWEFERAWCGEWFTAGASLEIGVSCVAAGWDVERSGFGAWVTTGCELWEV